MSDTPVRMFVFVICNLVIMTGCLTMALAVLPRLRVKLNLTVVAGMAFFGFEALQNMYVTYGLLADEMPAVGASMLLLALRIATAASLAAFVLGVFVDVARWKRLQDTMTRSGPDT